MGLAVSPMRVAYDSFFSRPQERSLTPDGLRRYVETHVFFVLLAEVRRFDRTVATVFERARGYTEQIWDAADGATLSLALLEHHEAGCFQDEFARLICAELSSLTRGDVSKLMLDERFQRMLAHADACAIRGVAVEDALLAYGETNVENSTAALIMIGALAAALAVVLALRARRELKKPTAEFQAVSKFAGATWANKLLRVGRTESWSLRRAWQDARLEPEEIEAAVTSLDGVLNYRSITPREADLVVAREMRIVGNQRDGAAWVLDAVTPGLRVGVDVLERAAVHAATADELALRRLSEHRLTRAYLTLHARSEQTTYLMSGTLRDLMTMEPERPVLDEWLAEIVRAAPGEAFSLIHPKVGDSYIEREMESINQVSRTSEAVVAAVKGLGLRRRNGEVVLDALVETRGRAK